MACITTAVALHVPTTEFQIADQDVNGKSYLAAVVAVLVTRVLDLVVSWVCIVWVERLPFWVKSRSRWIDRKWREDGRWLVGFWRLWRRFIGGAARRLFWARLNR
jgi:hypothetical protein